MNSAQNRYLIEATELAGSDNLLVEIARTRILLQQNKLPAARSSVDSLLEMSDRNKEVLNLLLKFIAAPKLIKTRWHLRFNRRFRDYSQLKKFKKKALPTRNRKWLVR